MKLFVGLLAVLTVISTQANSKDRDWKTGTLTDIQSQTGTWMEGKHPRNSEIISYQIETSEMIYVAKQISVQVIRLAPDPKPLGLTINGPVKFAIEKSDFYLQDENGKEHKLILEKKIAKHPTNSL
jgi:hypothetical protein